MKTPLKTVRKLIVGLVGFPLLIFGIILIPLPGPGLIVSFLALGVLSTEFKWANKYLDTTVLEIKKIYNTAKGRADKVQSSNKKDRR